MYSISTSDGKKGERRSPCIRRERTGSSTNTGARATSTSAKYAVTLERTTCSSRFSSRLPSELHGENRFYTGLKYPTRFAIILYAFALRRRIFVAVGTVAYLILRPGCLSLSVPIIFYVSIIGFCLIQLAGIFNDLIIMGISNMGSLAVTKPREKVEFFLYIALFIYFFEFAWDAFSTYTVFSDPVSSLQANCTSYSNVVNIYRAVVMIDWAVLAAIFVTFFILLDPLGCCLFSSLIRNIESDLERARIEADGGTIQHRPGVHKNYIDASLWMHRCKHQYCQCFRRGGLSNSERDALGDVVKAFGVLFSDVKYTSTDILSGFRLALVYHRKLFEKRKTGGYWQKGGDPTEEMKNVRST